MAQRTLEQRHSVRLKIGTPVTIPWMSKRGVTFELADEGDKVAEIKVTGAHIFVRRATKKQWTSFTFNEFLDRLVQ
jgi:hypothetical protein